MRRWGKGISSFPIIKLQLLFSLGHFCSFLAKCPLHLLSHPHLDSSLLFNPSPLFAQLLPKQGGLTVAPEGVPLSV